MNHVKYLFLSVFLLGTGFAKPAVAAEDCKINLQGNDRMKYNLKLIKAPKKCGIFKINLKHTGKLPKAAMGHNVIISQTKDVASLSQKAMKAGLKAEYVPKDKRVLAASRLIGGGQSTTLTVDLKKFKKGGNYTFFCSFPGHYALMKGKFIVQ